MRRMCSRLDVKYWTDVQMLDVSGSNERMSPRVKTPTRKSETIEKETGQQFPAAEAIQKIHCGLYQKVCQIVFFLLNKNRPNGITMKHIWMSRCWM